mgnify:CR=1 FL=1
METNGTNAIINKVTKKLNIDRSEISSLKLERALADYVKIAETNKKNRDIYKESAHELKKALAELNKSVSNLDEALRCMNNRNSNKADNQYYQNN